MEREKSGFGGCRRGVEKGNFCDSDPASHDCKTCLACTEVCPVGALSSKVKWTSFVAELEMKSDQRHKGTKAEGTK
ncbi:MAG: 4Fe-4S binding protein [Deltaproteobacteria bacterium]|nr:4Fe-4S binding protein [Deltaproteobacteria bacterium]